MYDGLAKRLRELPHLLFVQLHGHDDVVYEAADAIEELSKRIDRAVELYNRGVERSAMYEELVGIAPEPPKEE